MIQILFLIFSVTFGWIATAHAGPIRDLNSIINEREALEGSLPIQSHLSANENLARLKNRKNLAPLRLFANFGEEKFLRNEIKKRFPEYLKNPELLHADIRTLMNRAILSANQIQNEFTLIQKLKPSARLVPHYLGPNVFLRILTKEILNEIAHNTFITQLGKEAVGGIYYMLSSKVAAMENMWRRSLNPAQDGFLRKNHDAFKDWLNIFDIGDRMAEIDARLFNIRPEQPTEITKIVPHSAGGIIPSRVSRSNWVVTEATTTLNHSPRTMGILQTYAEKVSPTDLFEMTIKSIAPDTKTLEGWNKLRNAMLLYNVELWFRRDEEIGIYVTKDEKFFTAIVANEGKSIETFKGTDQLFYRAQELSDEYNQWFFIQIDRMVRNDPEARKKYFGQLVTDEQWKSYTKKMAELAGQEHPELLPAIEMNRGFYKLASQHGITTANRSADLLHFSELDYLRTIHNPDTFWELLFNMKVEEKHLTNAQIARRFQFLYETAGPVTRYEFSQAVFKALYAGQREEKAGSFAAYIAKDAEARNKYIEEFIDHIHANRNSPETEKAISALQGTLSSYFLDGGTLFNYEQMTIDARAMCIRGTR